MEDIKEFIVDYIQREYTLPADTDVMELNYIESGYIDSLGFVQFVALIEEEFDIVFSDEELDSPDMKVVGKLVALIDRKRNA
ncbi:MAG: acyl carrier protein [Bacteroidales bacterium]|nr:acyl carrier protein [Bacteroidales bacterium]